MRINKILYYGDFVVLPLVLAYLALRSLSAGAGAVPLFAGSLLVGFVAWTLAEYWIHRTLYHHAPVLSALHDAHHKAPSELIGIPSFLSAGIVIALTYVPFFAFAPRFAEGFASGALIGYAAYMIVHHGTHHWRIEPGHWLYRARVRHMAHHYHEGANFGIVTGFWDRVFGTAGVRRGRWAGA